MSRRDRYIAIGAVLLAAVCFALVGFGRAAMIGQIVQDHEVQADLLLAEVADDMETTLQYELNGARDIALALTDSSDEIASFEQAAAAYFAEQEGVRCAVLVRGTEVAAVYPASSGPDVGLTAAELPYAFSMAKLAHGSVVEGPGDYFGSGTEGILFAYPLFDEAGAYRGEVVVERDAETVLSLLGLDRLSEAGYEYELWRVDAHSGAKVVIATTDASFDYSPGRRTTFSLPSEWTLVAVPHEGWVGDDGRTAVDAAFFALGGMCALGTVLGALALSLFLKRRDAQCRDIQSDLLNRFGFERELDRRIEAGMREFAIMYFSVDGFARVSELAGVTAQKNYLVAVQRHMKDAIASPNTMARVGVGSFCVALYEEGVSDRELADVARNLSLEFMWKVEREGRKTFQSVGFQTARYPDDGETAHELVDGIIRAFYDRTENE